MFMPMPRSICPYCVPGHSRSVIRPGELRAILGIIQAKSGDAIGRVISEQRAVHRFLRGYLPFVCMKPGMCPLNAGVPLVWPWVL